MSLWGDHDDEYFAWQSLTLGEKLESAAFFLFILFLLGRTAYAIFFEQAIFGWQVMQ